MKRLLGILMLLLLALPASATTYYADISVGTSGDGSVGSPWKTIPDVIAGLDALPGNGDGDTVQFASGDYGYIDHAFWRTARVTGITLAAAPGATVYFSNNGNNYVIDLDCTVSTDTKITFNGIRIWCDNISPLPESDGYENYVVLGTLISNANGNQFIDCDIKGPPFRFLCQVLIQVSATSDGTVFSGCNIHHVGSVLVELKGTDDSNLLGDVTFLNCQITHAGRGNNIRCLGFMGGAYLVDRCLLADNTESWSGQNVPSNEPYVPWDEDAANYYHPGSSLSIRPCADDADYAHIYAFWDSFTIRRSIFIHGGMSAQPFYTYPGTGLPHGMTIESCILVGGSIKFHGLCPTVASPIKFLNNLSIAAEKYAYDDGLKRTEVWMRYDYSYQITVAEDAVGSYANIFHYNNVFRSQTAAAGGNFPTTQLDFTSDHNIYYACGGNVVANYAKWAGADDIWCVQNISGIVGNPNFMGDIGYDGTTAAYVYATHGVPDFFTDCNELVNRHDWTLANNNIHLTTDINPRTHGDLALASAYTIGGFDEDGYIQAGVGRVIGPGTCSVGPFEGADTLGYPLRPMLLSPCDGLIAQPLEKQLSWVYGIGAATYNVYIGTNEALVAARDASTLLGNTANLTYDPVPGAGVLAEATTYYWVVDSVSTAATVGKGWVHQFTTDDLPDPPGAASGFSPANLASDVAVAATVSWTNGSDTTSNDVYFSIDQDLVTLRDSSVKVVDDTLATSYDPPGSLAYSNFYYYRIVSRNDQGDVESDVYCFSTVALPSGTKYVISSRPPTPTNTFSGDANCKAVWNFESADLAGDSLSGMIDLTPVSDPSADTSAGDYKQGASSVYLDGDDRYTIAEAELPAGFPAKVGDATRDLSIACWFKIDTPPAVNESGNIIVKGDGDGVHCWALAVFRDAAQMVLRFKIGYNGGSSWKTVTVASPALSIGVWYHVVATWDNSETTWNTYTYAANSGATTHMGPTSTATAMSTPESSPVDIGILYTTWTYCGWLDELCVFSDVLTEAEAAKIVTGTYP